METTPFWDFGFWLRGLRQLDWTDPTLQWVVAGSLLLGIAAAVLGCFAFLRGRSLMGDALAHAALPGVCIAFITAEWARQRGFFDVGSKSLWLLLLGAGLAGMLAAWCISFIARHSRIKEDASQAIVLSVFFGIGILLLTWIQKGSSGNQAGLDKFLFGQAASLVASDVRTMGIVAIVLCVMTTALYKELKLLCFDGAFGRGLGLPMPFLDGLLLVMIVMAVVIGLQAVGVVLISAMLIIPPAAARFWTEKLHRMVPLSALLGGISGALGAMLSALAPRMPTGPLIVLAATFMFVISLLFAPRRGVLARVWRLLLTRRMVQRENVLRDLFELTEESLPQGVLVDGMAAQHLAKFEGVMEDELWRKRGGSEAALRRTLSDLKRSGWIEAVNSGRWRLTQSGLREAYEVVRRHRLWEMFLMYETSLGEQSVDRDADAVEHFLPPEALNYLENMMRQNGLEPRLKPASS
jgi:manganese/zinc/iron transport system permease protein